MRKSILISIALFLLAGSSFIFNKHLIHVKQTTHQNIAQKNPLHPNYIIQKGSPINSHDNTQSSGKLLRPSNIPNVNINSNVSITEMPFLKAK